MGQPWAWARPMRVLSRRSGRGAYHAARPSFRWQAADGDLAAVTGDLAAVGPGGRRLSRTRASRIWSWAVRPVALTTVPAAGPPGLPPRRRPAAYCGIAVMGCCPG